MVSILKKITSGALAIALAAVALAPIVHAEATTVTVTPSNLNGWVLNGDPTTATPYEFNEDAASMGEGSLYVLPVGSNASDKFIAAKTLGVEVADFDSVAYDFKVAGDGTVVDAQHFYLNVYTNIAGSTVFYNCRFDYVPTTGSTSDFTTTTFAAADTPVNVADRASDSFTCPSTLDAMPAGSTVSFVALNVGDTSVNDEGLAGYLDAVVISAAGDVTTYDFEADPTTLPNKEACKNGGWMLSEAPVFKNQGECVSSFVNNRP